MVIALQISRTIASFKITAEILLGIRAAADILYGYHIASLQRNPQFHIRLSVTGNPLSALTVISCVDCLSGFYLLRFIMVVPYVHKPAFMKPLVIELSPVLRAAITDNYGWILRCYRIC